MKNFSQEIHKKGNHDATELRDEQEENPNKHSARLMG